MNTKTAYRLLVGVILACSACPSMADDGMDRIPKRMREFVEQNQITGAVTLVARRGQVVHLEAVGQADVENGRAMTVDSLFAIASMTKPITATAVLMLRDEGRLSLDDPVSKYVPQFADVTLQGQPLEREITIRDLITHTSGIGGGQRNQGSLKNTVELIAAEPMRFAPGSRWQYSPGVTVCGRVVEVASGRPFERFLDERIFQPTGMEDTTFNPTLQQRARLARLYAPGEEKGTIRPAEHWLNEASDDRSPNPSGGLFSTAADMARFYQMILNGGELDDRRIVSAKSVQEMTAVQTGELATGFTPGNGWGLGWCVVREPQGVSGMLSSGSYGHGGAFGTQGWVDPTREMIFVLMIQRTNFGNSDGSEIRGDFQRLAVEASSPTPRHAVVHDPGKSVQREEDGQVVWRFDHGGELSKPYFHPVGLPGEPTLTWDRPPDHVWHHGLWFSWKYINGMNYWEPQEGQSKPEGRTVWSVADDTRWIDGDSGKTRLTGQLAYGPADGPTVLVERRVVEISMPDADGRYHFDWTCRFTAGDVDVKLDRTPLPGEPGGQSWGGYAGLSVRLAEELTERQVTSTNGPVEFDADSLHRSRALAMDYSGLLDGQPRGIAICDHPENLNHPTPWYAIRTNVMSYFSPAVVCHGPHTLPAGQTLTLRYRVIVHPGRWDASRLQREYDEYVSNGKTR